MANKIAADVLRDARAEAVRQLVNRERRDGLLAMLGALTRAIAWRREFLDDGELNDLGAERARIWFEADAYLAFAMTYEHDGKTIEQRGKPCALDGENLDDVLRRLLLERGASSYQVAKLSPKNIAANSKSRDARRAQKARLARLEANLAEVERSISAQTSPAEHALRAELKTAIEILSFDRKSSSRKRR